MLDGYLLRLARQDARCRRVLGRLARALLRRRGHHDLGFARLNDYTRERLGLSAREVQSLARVADQLERLPEIACAFDRGELSWTQVRQLVRVATPETQTGWLVLARERPARLLAALAGQAKLTDEDDDTIDGEPRVMVHIPCPRRVRARWRELMELARCMAGSPLCMWQAAEAVAAEGLSARGLEPDDPLAGYVAPEPKPPQLRPQPPALIDWSVVEEAKPEEVEHLHRGASDLGAFGLDERLRVVVRALQGIDWRTGRLLRLFLGRNLHRNLGFASAALYVRHRLGMAPRRARALLALERKSAQAPALLGAYRSGQLSWLRALTLLPVATERTARAWVDRAREVTLKRLADEVEWALSVRDVMGGGDVVPPPPGDALHKPEWQIGARDLPDAKILFASPASVAILLNDAIGAFTQPGEPRWRGFERLIEHVQQTWEDQPRHRDPIFARDGWRCAVPACSARRNLHDHHVLFRSRGGPNTRDNRITVCAWHHLRGIHRGRVRARGRAPADIVWELGVRPGRPPLLRLHGERYLDAIS